MTADKKEVLVGQFRIGKTEEIQAWIRGQAGHPFIEIQVYHFAGEGHAPRAGDGIPIPVTLLPELKRLVHRLEERLIEEGLSDEFQTIEQLREEREVNFAHPSERELARILDFYKIRWEYEPRTFPIRWDSEGQVLESFTPDFYLPEQDLYIELTTQKQALVTKKNRKVRLLKDLYPEVNIKIFYSRDFKRLLQKYGTMVGKK